MPRAMAVLSLPQALCRALALVTPGPLEQVALTEARARFLAEPVRAPRPLPGCDNSAMDGYAVRALDIAQASRERPASLELIGASFAGTAPQGLLGHGQAIRIFTGAPIPEGADAVVRQEVARATGSSVEVAVPAPPGENIRRRGEELAQGQQVLGAGARLDGFCLGLLAGLGIAQVLVRQRPTVAVLTLGDELQPPGQPALAHQVYDSNQVLLCALAQEAGAVVAERARLPDDPEQIRAWLQAAAGVADVVITSGGASVGDRDLMKELARELGAAFEVDTVALKPGKPVGVARLGDRLLVVLPGNPGAASVAFDQLVRPMLHRWQGAREVRRREVARLQGSRRKQPGSTYLLAATLSQTPAGPVATIRPQGSGQLLQNVGAAGWVVLPPGKGEFEEGDAVEVELFAGSRFEGADL
jgi:molybdopterin molybdotransferase